MRKALIIGCGYTGTALARQLSAEGIATVGTSAGSDAPELTGDGYRHRTIDLLQTADLSLPEAEDAVVYYMVSTLHRNYDQEQRPHLRPMRRCLDALARVRPRGLVYLSSTSVYGHRQGGWVDEDTEPAPRSPWGKMRVELEQAVWAFGAKHGVPTCVVRLPEIYGPGRGPQERLRQRDHVLHHPERFSNRIHIDDLALVLSTLGQRLDLRLLLVADNAPATRGEVYGYTAEALGCGLVTTHEEASGDTNLQALRQDSKRCRNARLLRWLGRPLRHPSYVDGITSILALETALD